MIFIDESSKIKSPNTAVTKAILEYSKDLPFCYLFSGTPAPNSELEYWPQFRVINPAILGKSFEAFKHRYFVGQMITTHMHAPWLPDNVEVGDCVRHIYKGSQKIWVRASLSSNIQYPRGQYIGRNKIRTEVSHTWIIREDKQAELYQRLGTHMDVVQKEDVLDLPPKTDNLREVVLSPKEKKAYEQMKKDLMVEFGGEMPVTATKVGRLMKLRQITAGFVYDEKRMPIDLGKTKINELWSVLEEVGNHQAIIWTQFEHEANRIVQLLIDNNKRWGRVDGTVKQTKKDEDIAAFKNGILQYMVAHPLSLGHGHTLINATYAIYASLSFSMEQFYQSKDRIYRKGQDQAVTYIYLVARDSVDPIIFNALKAKIDVVEAVFNAVKRKEA
jgi:SNF2 family DNA or RNA helicase